MERSHSSHKKYVPGSDVRPEEVFSFPYLSDEESVKFIADHGRVMFITRGPPGSGKNTLCDMICKKYPTAVACSADFYFSEGFQSKERTRETLAASHNFCQQRVKTECEKGTHPIVVRNTHVRKWELKVYLDFAAQFGYTVIMAISVRKFIIDPKVLARTNKKGLNEDYMRKRISGWKECIPLYLGWFLCPKDELFVFQLAKQSLESLLEEEKFSNTLGLYSKDELRKYFKTEKQLFCIAAFCNCGKTRGTYKFYLSPEVQDAYGKCFTLSIYGFVVSKDYVLAIVGITYEMKSLIWKNEGLSEETLENLMDSMTIEEPLPMGSSTFDEDFSSPGKTANLKDSLPEELMNINYMSFILLARANENAKISTDMQKLAQTLFGSIVSNDGIIEEQSFSEFSDGAKYIRLPNDLWLVSLPKKVVLSTVFTGLYFVDSKELPVNKRADEKPEGKLC